MMKKNINLKYLSFVHLFVLTLLCMIPSFVGAASVYIEPTQKNISEGDVVILDVKINSEKSLINAVDGSIVIDSPSPLSVREFSLAGSIFSLWPKSPTISSDGKTISFVGGVPGGFNSENAVLFKIILEGKSKGQVTISPKNIIAYINDGKGTKTQVKTLNSTIIISATSSLQSKDEWKSLMSSDITPPEDFVITIGQDNATFDGKKFAFFTAEDSQTGIDYYEVYEGKNDAVRSSNMYVLQDQINPPQLKVVAYDKAGNKKASVYGGEPKAEETASKYSIISIILIIIIILVAAVVGFLRRRFTSIKNL